jgi:hypothetical protein
MEILSHILLFFLVPAELYAEAECFASKGKFDFFTYAEVSCRKIFVSKCLDAICK